MSSVDFTGVTVCFNDGRYLGECLSRLKFCKDRVVVDLGSTDGSQETAAAEGARVINHAWAPVVEMVRGFAADQASTDWIVFLDPDLMFPASVIPDIERIILENPAVGLVTVRYQNYFMGKPLKYGRWGGVRSGYPAVLHRQRVTFSPSVHAGVQVLPEFQSIEAGRDAGDIIVHYWVDSWRQLLDKCERYLAREGESRFARGQRTGRVRGALAGFTTFFRSLIVQRGFLDGPTGIRLSALAGWYEWKAAHSLLKVQRQVGSAA